MYGRVSNHEVIIPYLSSFVGSGIRRAWRGKRGGCVARLWVVSVGVCGEGVEQRRWDVSECVRRRAERSLQGCKIK